MDIPLGEISHGFATHYHMDHAGDGEIAVVTRSWELLRSKGAKQVYAGHGRMRGMP
jgi:glyoxylase-like metal-dependent hydrolase (beta-lactamase superfamily II)